MTTLYQSLVAVEPFTLICTILNLFIQMFIVKTFFLDKIKAVLDARRAAADEQIEAARTAREQAETMKAEYEQNLAQAKAEAGEIVAAARKTAADRSEEMLSEARAQAARVKEQAEADLVQEKRKAMLDLKSEIGGMAMEIAGKVVERELDQNDHQALIDSFLEKVGDAS